MTSWHAVQIEYVYITYCRNRKYGEEGEGGGRNLDAQEADEQAQFRRPEASDGEVPADYEGAVRRPREELHQEDAHNNAQEPLDEPERAPADPHKDRAWVRPRLRDKPEAQGGHKACGEVREHGKERLRQP